MKRLLGALAASVIVLAGAAPAMAADPAEIPHTGRVLVSVQGDVTIPAGEHADAVVVIDGNATILGTVNAVTVIRGSATLTGAQVETLAIVDGTANLSAGTVVFDDVLYLNSTVNTADGVVVQGNQRSLADDFAGFALFLGTAAILMWIGALIALLVAGLLLAAFAARQVRSAEAIISREPVKAFLAGLAMVVVPPLVAFVLVVTILGLPLGLGLLLVVWPTLAFIGYVVAAIWIGDWLLRALGRTQVAERPYLAAVVGLVVTGIAGIVPLVSAIVSIFGLGAVTVAGWRTLTGGRAAQPTFQPTPAPVAG